MVDRTPDDDWMRHAMQALTSRVETLETLVDALVKEKLERTKATPVRRNE